MLPYADVLPGLPRGRDLPGAVTCKMARLIAMPITIRGKQQQEDDDVRVWQHRRPDHPTGHRGQEGDDTGQPASTVWAVRVGRPTNASALAMARAVPT
jgi:hypothetical protein